MIKTLKQTIKVIRANIFKWVCYFNSRNKGIINCNVNGFVKLNGKESFGRNVNFNGCKVYGNGEISFGDNFHSAKGLIFLTTYHNHNGSKIPYDESVIHKNVKIADNVWIGMNVTILGGVTIGEGAIIQAGSVVVSDIPSCSIAGGHPAKVFSSRDKDRYFELKAEGKFF